MYQRCYLPGNISQLFRMPNCAKLKRRNKGLFTTKQRTTLYTQNCVLQQQPWKLPAYRLVAFIILDKFALYIREISFNHLAQLPQGSTLLKIHKTFSLRFLYATKGKKNTHSLKTSFSVVPTWHCNSTGTDRDQLGKRLNSTVISEKTNS